MQRLWIVMLVCVLASGTSWAQQAAPKGPTDAKAQKTFADANSWLKSRNEIAALDAFKKADKQDSGHCEACQEKMLDLGMKFSDYKTADTATQEMIAEATDARSTALAHETRGNLLMREGKVKNKADFYVEADKEYKIALAAFANFPTAVFDDAMALACMNQDDAAKAGFKQYISMEKSNTLNLARAERYLERPELARARMAPPFALTTLDGKHVSLDELQGKVVLIDFWATWCGPCREALPHIREIAQKFQSQPLVVLSVSLDKDDTKWKDFVSKNGMTWLQYRDDSGDIAHMFAVNMIPHTFTIDADGVLQDEHIGDASIEGKLKKLCSRAHELQSQTATKASL